VIASVTVDEAAARANIVWADGHLSTFPHAWLRDHCRCSECVGETTFQRQFDTAAIGGSQAVRCTAATVSAAADGAATLTLEMGVAAADGHMQEHRAVFPLAWLRRHCFTPSTAHPPRTDDAQGSGPRTWSRESLAAHCAASNAVNNSGVPGNGAAHHLASVPFIEYDALLQRQPCGGHAADEGGGSHPIRRMLREYGIACVSGIPLAAAAAGSGAASERQNAAPDTGTAWSDPAVCAVETVVRDFIGFPRETFWGYIWDTAGDLGDVVSKRAAAAVCQRGGEPFPTRAVRAPDACVCACACARARARARARACGF